MGGLHTKKEKEKKPTVKRDDPEKRFSDEILKSIHALESSWTHCYDQIGHITSGTLARRPADREVVWQGRHFLLELKASDTDTLPFSKFDRGTDNKRHQCKTLIAQHAAGGFGLVLVLEQRARRCWCIQAPVLEAAGLHEGARGSFVLGPPFLQVGRVAHPRGFAGQVWDLRILFWSLMEGRGFL